ncbi:ParB/RepB/Spo0J family partition protein [Lutispora saccharofermentans]|uniref:ParB/RepB/Spo0J family partition protein n=1 Tax=Lutispora saccharofermentans TaxID=3024236 RepID=A0ABT1NK76_9FIRM|nr:ParB/RepB/Spo0J family partition protein [Lutispora saccharofermentans]MCQ1531670.1 ParB/RepB/Spo0J family partition protein [Lutispora saccharofermentans]
MAKKALGKGLSALIPENPELSNDNSVLQLKITEIEANENQPRRKFDEEALNSLAESIKEHGIVQPIIVRRDGEGYQIVAGERRWRAARIAGLKAVPVVVKDYSETQILEIALIENLQREDLNPIEEANAYKTLMEEHSFSQDEIGKRIGKSRSAITNSLRLLNLPAEIVEHLVSGKLTAGHARAILAFDDDKKRIEVAERIINEGLNVRQVEKLSKEKKSVKRVKTKSAEICDIEERLRNIFGTKVTITHSKKKGKIEIEYYGIDDLDKILDLLEK